MQTVPLTYYSDGLKLDGFLQLPDDIAPGERRPAVIICSGFLGLKEWVPARWWPSFVAAGFVAMAFDYRGFGASDGERGRMFPEEEIRDVIASLTCLRQQPWVDPERIGLLGWGLGGGIVVATAARDQRVKAVACVNGLGDAGRATRDAVAYPVWLALQDRIAEDRVTRVMTGESGKIHYRDVTHPGQSGGDTWKVQGASQFQKDLVALGTQPTEYFSLASAEAYYAFRPEDVVHHISPRPLLIVHGDRNPFMPLDEARSLYAKAREPKDLMVIEGAEHLEWIAPDSPFKGPYVSKIVSWFGEQLAEGRGPAE